jgi:hypothetical protein
MYIRIFDVSDELDSGGKARKRQTKEKLDRNLWCPGYFGHNFLMVWEHFPW